MSRVRQLTIAFAAARGAFGLGLMAVPGRMASAWLGSDSEREPTQVVIRGLGARDVALAAGTIAAAFGQGPLRPWLIGAAGCDLSDIASTLATGDSLPERAKPGTIALAGVSVLAGAALAAAADA